MSTAADPRYPIGEFVAPAEITAEDRQLSIHSLAQMPELLREAVRGLDDAQMDTPYRKGGWTMLQVVHHVADSHSTALFRLKKALTEDWPTVPGYKEALFALLPDVTAPAELSLTLIESVHARWIAVLQALEDSQWRRGYTHEERGRTPLDLMTVHYAWHAKHHVAHINHLRAEKGW